MSLPNSEYTNQNSFEQEKQKMLRHFSLQLKRSQRGLEEIKRKEEESRQWQKIYHEGELLQANFFRLKKGMKQIEVDDWEKDGVRISISLNPEISLQDEVSQRFKKSKKLKKSLEHFPKLIQKYNEYIEKWSTLIQETNSAKVFEELPQLKNAQSSKKKEAEALPFHSFNTESGLQIWVGKSARSNEKLTFQHAHGADWWLHVSGFSGSHVVLRPNKGQSPDEEALEDALQLALYYSKGRNAGATEVSITQKKFVSRIGKQLGKVQISKHQHRLVKLDPLRLQKIRERKMT